MAKIKIGDKDFDLKYTIESWKRLKEVSQITPMNIQQKMEEGIAEVISDLVFFGLSKNDREQFKTREIIDQSLDFSAVDSIMKAVEESLPEAAKAKMKKEFESATGVEKKD